MHKFGNKEPIVNIQPIKMLHKELKKAAQAAFFNSLFGIIDSPGFTDNRYFNLSRISHFSLNFLCNFCR